jgi:hypothetical protein
VLERIMIVNPAKLYGFNRVLSGISDVDRIRSGKIGLDLQPNQRNLSITKRVR